MAAPAINIIGLAKRALGLKPSGSWKNSCFEIAVITSGTGRGFETREAEAG